MKSKIKQIMAGSCLALGAVVAVPASAETLDLMVLYTNDALQHQNGRDINARIAAAVEWTNQAYRNSGADVELRLVHTEQASSRYNGWLTGTQLDWLTNDADVNKLRQQHGADFVTMIGPSQDWCGLGWVPGGNGSTGRFHNGASSWAYNLVSISCSNATFAHELGHNMSLGHSNKQNSSGGVWRWARGHGESGRFVTIMGYTSAFNTWNRLQFFSNPAVNQCEGSACGVPHNDVNGADSARNLNLLASQLSDFMPTQHDGGDDGDGGDNGGGDNGGGDNGGGDNGGGDNGGGDNGGGDNSGGNDDEYRTLRSATDVCLDVENGATAAGTAVIPARCTGGDNQLWQLDEQGFLKPKHVEDMCLSVGPQVDYHKTAFITHCRNQPYQQWQFDDNIIRNRAATNMALDVYQQQGQIGVWSVHGNSNQQWSWGEDNGNGGTGNGLCVKPELDNNLVQDGDFNQLASWDAFMDTAVLEQTFEQRNCGKDNRLKVASRSVWYAGPIQDITQVIQQGTSYDLSLKAKLSGSDRETLRVALRISDSSGTHYQYLVQKSVTSGEYSELAASFIPAVNGTLKKAEILVYGPQRQTEFYLDEVLLLPTEVVSTALLDSHFEQDRDGWKDAYGAIANRSIETAAAGNGSLKLSNRRYWYAGAVRDVKGIVEGGKQYQLSLNAMVPDTQAGQQTVDIRLLYQDQRGYHWKTVTRKTIAPGLWSAVDSELSFTVSGDIKSAQLYVFGPEAGVELFLDQIRIEEQ